VSKILDSVIADFKARETRGIMKYGVTMDRSDLLSHEWIQHMMEELMDAIIYLKKIQDGSQRHTDSQEADCPVTKQIRSSRKITGTGAAVRQISKGEQGSSRKRPARIQKKKRHSQD
jgi:hypothetical protein